MGIILCDSWAKWYVHYKLQQAKMFPLIHMSIKDDSKVWILTKNNYKYFGDLMELPTHLDYESWNMKYNI